MVQTEKRNEQIERGTFLENSVETFINSFAIERPDGHLVNLGLTGHDGFSPRYWSDKHRRLGELRDEYVTWAEECDSAFDSRAMAALRLPTKGAPAFIEAAGKLRQAVRDGIEELKRGS